MIHLSFLCLSILSWKTRMVQVIQNCLTATIRGNKSSEILITWTSQVFFSCKSSSVLYFSVNEECFTCHDPSHFFHCNFFSGDKSEFVVRLSVEVNAGLVMTTLPAYLINTTELILESKHHWQPLLAFAAISKQVFVRGKGIRFYCTLVDCNNALQQLKFEVSVLILTCSTSASPCLKKKSWHKTIDTHFHFYRVGCWASCFNHQCKWSWKLWMLSWVPSRHVIASSNSSYYKPHQNKANEVKCRAL